MFIAELILKVRGASKTSLNKYNLKKIYRSCTIRKADLSMSLDVNWNQVSGPLLQVVCFVESHLMFLSLNFIVDKMGTIKLALPALQGKQI